MVGCIYSVTNQCGRKRRDEMDVETDSLITFSFPLMLEALEVFFLKKSLIVLSLRLGAFFDKNSIR